MMAYSLLVIDLKGIKITNKCGIRPGLFRGEKIVSKT